MCKIGVALLLILTVGKGNVDIRTCSARDFLGRSDDIDIRVRTRDVTLFALCFISRIPVEDAGGLSACQSYRDRRIRTPQRLRIRTNQAHTCACDALDSDVGSA